MMTLYLCVGESPPTVNELGPGWCSRYSLARSARLTRARRVSSLMGGPLDPGDAPRPLGEVPLGEGGRLAPGEGGRAPLLAPLAAAEVVVGEAGLREATAPEGAAPPTAPGVLGEGGREGALAAPGDPLLRARAVLAALAASANLAALGDGFRRPAPPLDGDRCRRTRGEVGGVARFEGGDGGVGVTLEEWLREDTPILPLPTYRRAPGLMDRSLCSCLTGDDLGDDLGDVLGEVLGESRDAAAAAAAVARVLAWPLGSGETGRLRWDPRGGGPGPTGDRTSFAALELVGLDTVEVDGCLATRGPFFVTPSPPPFRSLSLKLAVSILDSLPPSLRRALAGEDRSPAPPRL